MEPLEPSDGGTAVVYQSRRTQFKSTSVGSYVIPWETLTANLLRHWACATITRNVVGIVGYKL